MHSSIIFMASAFALSTAATPLLASRDSSSFQPVTFIHENDALAADLPKAPSTLKSDEKAFLNQFQPAANKLPAGQDISNGWCYEEYPCSSISGAATAEIPGSNGKPLPAISVSEITSLLNDILQTPTTKFTPSFLNHLTSANLSSSGVDLTIYSLPSNVSSEAVAGAAFDLYKIHTDDTSTNAVRGVQVANKFILCLTPSGADATVVQNFCIGRELNGASPPASEMPTNGSKVKRGSLGIGCAPLAVVPIIGWLAAAFCGTF